VGIGMGAEGDGWLAKGKIEFKANSFVCFKIGLKWLKK